MRRKGSYARNTQIGSHTMETLSCVSKSIRIKLYSSFWSMFSSPRGFLHFSMTTHCVPLHTQGHPPVKAKHSHSGAVGDTMTCISARLLCTAAKKPHTFLLLLFLSVTFTAIALGILAAIKEGWERCPRWQKGQQLVPDFLLLQASAAATPHKFDYLVLVCCKQNL